MAASQERRLPHATPRQHVLSLPLSLALLLLLATPFCTALRASSLPGGHLDEADVLQLTAGHLASPGISVETTPGTSLGASARARGLGPNKEAPSEHQGLGATQEHSASGDATTAAAGNGQRPSEPRATPETRLPSFTFQSHGASSDDGSGGPMAHGASSDDGPMSWPKGPSRNGSVPHIYSAPFFERRWATGWFSSPVILNTHVESSQLMTLLTQRKLTHYPSFVTAHCVEYPTAVVLFNVLWIPNQKNWRWSLVLNVDGADLQLKLNQLMAAGQKPKQIDSYAFRDHGTIYYSAIFIGREKWDPDVKFTASFGTPKDNSFCCGPGSRWGRLLTAGYKPLSLSVTQDPATGALYVADVWNNRTVPYWQGAMDKSPGELQPILGALPPPLVPIYIKSYRVTYASGGFNIFYSYIAEADDGVTSYASTIDISRSGLELLARMNKFPPLFVTSHFLEGEIDPQDPSSGEMYGALWQGVASARPSFGRRVPF